MSFEIQGRVMSQSQTKQSQRMLLLILAYHADKFGVCWPSVGTLAKELNTNIRNAGLLVSKLKKTGEIMVIEGGGRNNSNTYIITIGQSQEIINDILKNHSRFNDSRPINVINPVNNDRELTNENPVIIDENPVIIGGKPCHYRRKTLSIMTDELKGTEIRTEIEQQHVAADDFNSPELSEDLPDLNPDLTRAMKLYKDNIGPMNGIVSSDFSDLFYGLSPPPGETKQDWVEYAIVTASANGINKWSYIKAIINGISGSGSLANHKELWNENGSGTGKRQATGDKGESGLSDYAKKYNRDNDENIAKFVQGRTIS